MKKTYPKIKGPRYRKMYKRGEHLYKGTAKKKELKRFEATYGVERGRYIYGATVGKVKRERTELRKGR
jgi:hypothetical protein